MIVDSSALVALVFRERDEVRILDAIAASETPLAIGAPTLAETSLVLAAKLGERSRLLLARLVEELDLVVVPFRYDHARMAREAWLRFGRGRHPAKLNFGDCLTYAVAKLAGEPLLFTGHDFSKTDLERAIAET